MSNKKTAQRDKPKAPPAKPRVLRLRLPKNVRVLEDGTIVRTLRG